VARSYRELELAGVVATRGRHGTTVVGQASVERGQAAIEARRFVARMRELGLGPSETLALVRRESGTTDRG
jgi:DNA-binding transcriptional regulator YhcF (GntR family)